MNLYNIVNNWEDVIADLIIKIVDSKDETNEALVYRVFEEIFKITSKVNFYNKEKLFNCFYKTLENCEILQKEKIISFYKYICKNLCGIKSNFYNINIKAAVQDLIGFDKFEEMYEWKRII